VDGANITSLDVKLRLLPGSRPINLSGHLIHLNYMDNKGTHQGGDYTIENLHSDYVDPYYPGWGSHDYNNKMKIIYESNNSEGEDPNLITRDTTVTLRFTGNFNTSGNIGSIGIYLHSGPNMHIDIKMPSIVDPSLNLTKYRGVVLLNNTNDLEIPRSNEDDWVILNNTYLEDQEIVLNRNLIIGDHGFLSLSNVTLRINSSENRELGIYVGEKGTLNAYKSTITSLNSPASEIIYGEEGWAIWPLEYNFQIFGNMKLDECELIYPYNSTGGFEIFSDDVIISNCTIFQGDLLCKYSSPKILNNVFCNESYINSVFGSPVIKWNIFKTERTYSIWCEYGSAVITNNIINSSSNGIRCTGGHFEIRDNTIKTWYEGIRCHDGRAIIEDNFIESSNDYGIIIAQGTSQIRNNIITGADGGILLFPLVIGKSPDFYQGIIENNVISGSGTGIMSSGDSYGFTSKHLFRNNLILNGTLGIACKNTDLVISNESLNTQLIGLVLIDSTAQVLNVTMKSSIVGVILSNSTSIIVNSYIKTHFGQVDFWEIKVSSSTDLYLSENAEARITNSKFDQNNILFEDEKSRVVLPNKTLSKNEPFPWLYVYIPLSVLSLIIIIGMIIQWRIRKRYEGRNL